MRFREGSEVCLRNILKTLRPYSEHVLFLEIHELETKHLVLGLNSLSCDGHETETAANLVTNG